MSNFFKNSDIEASQAEAIVSETLKNCDDGELYFEDSKSESIVLDDNKIKSSNYSSDLGFGFRAISDEVVALDITDEIGDSNSVVLRVSGTAQGINGSYNNNYAMVYTFKDGKIIALNEYNSDLLAETRLYKKQVVPTN